MPGPYRARIWSCCGPDSPALSVSSRCPSCCSVKLRSGRGTSSSSRPRTT